MEIVVGALTTPTGSRAIRRAAEEAARTGGKVHVVAFVEPPRDGTAARSYQQELARIGQQLEGEVPELLGREVPWEVHVPAGFSRPSDAIVNVVERIGADLVVIGMRRRSRVGKAVLGSNAADILLQVDCGVLSVPAPEDANW